MYCIDKQLITKKEKKVFRERQQILKLHNLGMPFHELLEYFGKKRKKYIKRVLLEESFEPEDGPGIIRINRTAKLKLAHKQFLQNLIDDPHYLGGLTDTFF